LSTLLSCPYCQSSNLQLHRVLSDESPDYYRYKLICTQCKEPIWEARWVTGSPVRHFEIRPIETPPPIERRIKC